MASKEAEAKVPRSIKVGPYIYTVDFDGEAAYDYSFLGVCLNRSRRIKLDPRQSDTELPQTLLHETIHAIGCAFEITEWGRHTTNDKGEITDKIDLMASAMLQFIRDNPSVISWLQKQR